ncbi:flagellar hook assembly protein FlgD [Sphingopyxis sp. PET50]|uniref:flagellar hook assembly protein FlgD n=1 Tax=Sphingopyxis sp. PET50 TaxID=2976533 RepID=UPI0021B0630D|nr:flagellar hook capping FlgD N-terminal domain-containing protein [Sphingopyxis sp. PET50]
MAVNSVTNTSNVVIQPKGSANQMGQSDFLRLMTAQLSQQDPFNPVDNQAMVAQMAQFSSLAGITETNSTLQQISEQLTAQTRLLQDIKAATTPAAATDTTTQEG